MNNFDLTVIPSEGLSIDGSEPTSGIDNLINLTCSANPSNPAQSLIWYINDQKVKHKAFKWFFLTLTLFNCIGSFNSFNWLSY